MTNGILKNVQLKRKDLFDVCLVSGKTTGKGRMLRNVSCLRIRVRSVWSARKCGKKENSNLEKCVIYLFVYLFLNLFGL